jgi:hypothetical protein
MDERSLLPDCGLVCSTQDTAVCCRNRRTNRSVRAFAGILLADVIHSHLPGASLLPLSHHSPFMKTLRSRNLLPTSGILDQRRMLIIGSGPSAKEIVDRGLHNLPPDVDTFGMGAQYRFYQQMNWWPTYYALADTKVVFSHRKALRRMVEDLNICTKRFYFSWPVSDHYRFERILHSSTGDFCIKKSVELGYRRIFIIGIEGSYVEEIAQSRPLTQEEFLSYGFGQLDLPNEFLSYLRIITETPEHNPNYFFEGYQRVGDVYSLPRANLHRRAASSAADIARSVGAKVINLSRQSQVLDFPKSTVSAVFGPVKHGGSGDDPHDRQASSEAKETWYGPFEPTAGMHLDEVVVALDQIQSRDTEDSDSKPYLVAFERLEASTVNHIATRGWSVDVLTPDRQGQFCLPADVRQIDVVRFGPAGIDPDVVDKIDLDRYMVKIVLWEFQNLSLQREALCLDKVARRLLEMNFALYISEWHATEQVGGSPRWKMLKSYPCALGSINGRITLLAFRTDPGISSLVWSISSVNKESHERTTAALRRELDGVYNSLSWKVTAPLRRLWDLLVGLRCRWRRD